MNIITKIDVIANIDAAIQENPNILKVELNSYESTQFLDKVPELHKEGTLQFNGSNSYIYKGIDILVVSKLLLG